MTTNFLFHPSFLLLFLDPGSGMGKNQHPGSGLNIQDPQHCLLLCLCVSLHAHFHAYVSASVCISMPMCKPTCAFLCLFVILPARLHAKLHTGTFLQCCGTGTDRTVIFALVEP